MITTTEPARLCPSCDRSLERGWRRGFAVWICRWPDCPVTELTERPTAPLRSARPIEEADLDEPIPSRFYKAKPAEEADRPAAEAQGDPPLVSDVDPTQFVVLEGG